MQPFVCLICGFRAEASADCRHCELPLLDSRLPEVEEAIVKADDARRHKHEQRLLWVAVVVVVFVIVVMNGVTFSLGFALPGIQQGAFGLLVGFGAWRGLIKLVPAHSVAAPAKSAPEQAH